MNSIDSELVSSTLPSQIYLVRRYYNVAATFVLNEYTAIFQKYVGDLTKRGCNVVKTLDMIHFQYWRKINTWIKYFTLFGILCLI